MAYRIIPDEDIERAFDIYCSIPINPHTEQPSIAQVASKTGICEKSVRRIRDRDDWETRRKEIIRKANLKRDSKRAGMRARKIEIVENLDNAGLNYLASKVREGKLKVSISEGIALGRFLLLLQGEPDSHQGQSGGMDLRIRCKNDEERLQLTRELQRNLEQMIEEDERKSRGEG